MVSDPPPPGDVELLSKTLPWGVHFGGARAAVNLASPGVGGGGGGGVNLAAHAGVN